MADNPIEFTAASVAIISPPEGGFTNCALATGTISGLLFGLLLYELAADKISDGALKAGAIILCVVCGLLMAAGLGYGGYKGLQACGFFPASDHNDDKYNNENRFLLN
jgi:hypothetical protein